MRSFNCHVIIMMLVLSLTSCANRTPDNKIDVAAKEDILLKSKNYSGLINLYRSWLKKKDTPEVRIKLAYYYYQAGDYKSSLYYLQPFNNKPNMRVYSLQAKNMISLGDYKQAIRVTDKMLEKEPANAEAYNLRGVALAMSGKLKESRQEIEKSRALFISDDVAINNLAMLEIINKRYQEAVGLLLPQYLRGRKSPRMLHNLVFSLVKIGDRKYARSIIEKEELSRSPEDLMDALSHITAIDKGAG